MKRLLFGSLLALAACDLSVDEPTYPTMLRPLSEAEQASATEAYLELNEGRMRTSAPYLERTTQHLDAYGLTRITEGICIPPPPDDRPGAIREAVAVEIARDAVVRNVRFTNVDDAAGLRVEQAWDLERAGWKVTFADQTVQGADVLGTGVTVWLDADGAFCIDGHWYDDVAFAPSPLSPAEALEAVVGDSLERQGYIGPGRVVALTETDLPTVGDVVKSTLPVEFDDRIELRTVWEFDVLDSEFRLYVDAETGETLVVNQLVIYN